MNSRPQGSRPDPLSIDAAWGHVDPLAADSGANPAESGLAVLPYSQLGGPGFERLVYELLHAENQRPWFFGRNGDPQYGIDIVTNTTEGQSVYQCKNHTKEPSWTTVHDAIAKFECEWLGDMNLTAPYSFVYCCPQPLDSCAFAVEWLRFKEDFKKRTGVELFFWNRADLDTRLKRAPDIVATLFSDSCAEHFCGRDGWRDDPWIRVQQGTSRHLGINRFLDRHGRNAIYVDESHETCFHDALDQGSVVALSGLPGSGKTFLALELACRLRQPLRRIYYTTFKDAATTERLWQSAQRRLSLPSVFVLDDCHLAPESVGIVLERLAPKFRNGNLKFVLLLRDQTGSSVDDLDDSPEWLTYLKEEQAVIELRADPARTLAVTINLRPDFKGLSAARLEHLHHASGGDLLLLDELLQGITTPQELDDLQLDKVMVKLRSQYFGGNRHLPTIAKLAALAQFDLVPHADFFDSQWQANEETLADPLMTRLFAPQRFQFLHSSLAELVFRAQTLLDVSEEALDKAVVSNTINVLHIYLLHLYQHSERKDADLEAFIQIVQQCLSGKLKLTASLNESIIKATVLEDEEIRCIIEASLSYCSFSFLHDCLRHLTASCNSAKSHYVELVEKRFKLMIARRVSEKGSDAKLFTTFYFAIYTLFIHAPERLNAVLEEHGAQGFLRLIHNNGTLFELFCVLSFSTPIFRKALLDQLDSTQAMNLIEKTISARRSIGTLHLTMRELGKVDMTLLVRLEQILGAQGFLRLIHANGTLFELFSVLQYSTTAFRTALLEQLDTSQGTVLIEKTISAGRSIGTLHLAMRDLGKADSLLLGRLEQVIGAQGFLRFIQANGTLFELFKVIQYSTPAFRTALLEHLDSAQSTALINKTISAGRSIGTLHLAMRDLGKADSLLLGRLEQVVGAQGFLRLIQANGTLFELFKVIQYSTPAFRTALLEHLDSAQSKALINKTISAGRSLGTLDFTMRDLGKADPELLGRLEQVIGAQGFLRLIHANGTLIVLSNVLHRSTPAFRTALLEQLDPVQAAALIDKTIIDAQGIENLHFAFKTLTAIPEQRVRLEQVIGVAGWWRLFIANSSLNSLSQITQAMSEDFCTQLIADSIKLSVKDWGGIITRGLFLNSCNFSKGDLPTYPEAARNTFSLALKETATLLAAKATWFDLNPSRPSDEPEHAEGVILREALLSRMRAVELAELFDLDLREAVNALALCWRERADLHAEITNNIHKILPPSTHWPRNKGEIAVLRLALALIRNTEFPEQDAHILLREIGAFLDREVCADIDTLPLFMLIWSMAALCYERGRDRNFKGSLPPALQEVLLVTLLERVKPKGPNKEKLFQLSLAGLLALMYPQLKERLVKLLSPIKGAVPWLVELAMQKTFVPALFALEGIALFSKSRVFTPQACEELLRKSEEYEDVGPAIEYLRKHVSERGGHLKLLLQELTLRGIKTKPEP